MTPKEKAKELGSKFNFEHIGQNYILHQTVDESKRCALIAVDEIIEMLSFDLGHDDTARGLCEYWESVKTEIQLL